jgi:threonine dehydratase
VFIHAFNDPAIVAGQGTVGMELLEQCPFLDAVVVPIGGGGLIAGMSLFIKSINPRIKSWSRPQLAPGPTQQSKVYGVESEAMAGMLESVKAGKVVTIPKRPSIADGIAIERIGQVCFPIIQRYVDQIVTVGEDEIASAVLTLLEREKTVVEGSGAAALAALKKLDVKEQTVAIILTGGNIDMSLLSQVIEKGLVKEGRLLESMS